MLVDKRHIENPVYFATAYGPPRKQVTVIELSYSLHKYELQLQEIEDRFF